MQNLEQLTRELGQALQLQPQYVRYVAANEARQADEILAEQTSQLELVRMQYQHEAQKGSEVDAAKMEEYSAQFKQLHTAILGSDIMLEYQQAVGDLDALVQHISGIISGCANGEDPATYEPKARGGGCGGGCGGGHCGGCG